MYTIPDPWYSIYYQPPTKGSTMQTVSLAKFPVNPRVKLDKFTPMPVVLTKRG